MRYNTKILSRPKYVIFIIITFVSSVRQSNFCVFQLLVFDGARCSGGAQIPCCLLSLSLQFCLKEDMEEYNSTRKRPRSTSPVPSSSTRRPKTSFVPSSGESFARRLGDPDQRNGALNELLKLTVSHEINYSLESDHILKALVAIYYETIGWERSTATEKPSFQSRKAWTGHATNDAKAWADFCKAKLAKGTLGTEKLKVLESIVVILRNLSFVAANLRLLAYSPEILAVLAGSLYESASCNIGGSGDDSNATSHSLAFPALHVLVNLAPYLDVTGQKLFCDKLFLSSGLSEECPQVPSPSTFGIAADGSWGFGGLWLAKRLDTKEDVVQDVSKEMLLQLTQTYLVRVWSIFPALASILIDSTAPRQVIMMVVDLLQEFINHARVGVIGSVEDQDTDVPNARSILVNIPTASLQRLMDLLYIPRLGPDSLEYVDPVQNIVTRVTTLKLLMGYDATVDTDVRDRALDVLVPLLELDSPRLAKRLGTKDNGSPQNRLYDAIFPILATKVGRNEAPLLASQLLRELAKAKENRVGCLYVQERIIALASKDPRVAHLAYNHLYSVEDDV